MKKLFLTIMIISLVLLNAQGSITNTLGTNDASSSFLITNQASNPLCQVYGDGWTGFGTSPPLYPHHVVTNHYDSGGPWLQPGAFFNSYVTDQDAVGLAGQCANTDWYGIGVYGVGGWTGVRGYVASTSENQERDYQGVYGYASSYNALSRGVKGYSDMGYRTYGGWFYGGNASDRSYGIRGWADGGPINYGVYGYANGAASGGDCYGIFGHADGTNARNYGGYFYASGATNNWAVYANGDLYCSGTLSKAAGSFKIDHPLDPENKYLSHSFVESPDMMNIYNGNTILDYSGEAEIELPEWFEALNRDYRYQLTAINAPGPNLYVSEEVNGNQFRIAGGAAGMKVSWQVTGIRKDAYANNHRIKVEEYKDSSEIGRFLHPEEYGVSKEKAINTEPMNQEKEKLTKDKDQSKLK